MWGYSSEQSGEGLRSQGGGVDRKYRTNEQQKVSWWENQSLVRV